MSNTKHTMYHFIVSWVIRNTLCPPPLLLLTHSSFGSFGNFLLWYGRDINTWTHTTLDLTHVRNSLGCIISESVVSTSISLLHSPSVTCPLTALGFVLFYDEQQIKQELKGIHICGCRCNERLKAKTDGCMRLTYTRSFIMSPRSHRPYPSSFLRPPPSSVICLSVTWLERVPMLDLHRLQQTCFLIISLVWYIFPQSSSFFILLVLNKRLENVLRRKHPKLGVRFLSTGDMILGGM